MVVKFIYKHGKALARWRALGTECTPGRYCWTEAVIPTDLYCTYFDCSPDIEVFMQQVGVCAPTRPEEFTRCGWNQRTGCGTSQFVERSDESWSFRIAFDEATGALLGFTHGSDTSMNICGADFLRVGTFRDYFWKPDTPCEDVQTNYCCEE